MEGRLTILRLSPNGRNWDGAREGEEAAFPSPPLPPPPTLHISTFSCSKLLLWPPPPSSFPPSPFHPGHSSLPLSIFISPLSQNGSRTGVPSVCDTSRFSRRDYGSWDRIDQRGATSEIQSASIQWPLSHEWFLVPIRESEHLFTFFRFIITVRKSSKLKGKS